jgi:hypothetical protein
MILKIHEVAGATASLILSSSDSSLAHEVLAKNGSRVRRRKGRWLII